MSEVQDPDSWYLLKSGLRLSTYRCFRKESADPPLQGNSRGKGYGQIPRDESHQADAESDRTLPGGSDDVPDNPRVLDAHVDKERPDDGGRKQAGRVRHGPSEKEGDEDEHRPDE